MFSFFAPAIFTRNIPLLSYIPWVNEVCFNEKTGVIGDTFGIMNPFIAIAAAVITGLAFWEQYKANQQLKDDNAKQQVERQFYEMLKIHRDNVAEFITRREGANSIRIRTRENKESRVRETIREERERD